MKQLSLFPELDTEEELIQEISDRLPEATDNQIIGVVKTCLNTASKLKVSNEQNNSSNSN
jgi:hypothetical protein